MTTSHELGLGEHPRRRPADTPSRARGETLAERDYRSPQDPACYRPDESDPDRAPFAP
jgi:hypothetical protein